MRPFGLCRALPSGSTEGTRLRPAIAAPFRMLLEIPEAVAGRIVAEKSMRSEATVQMPIGGAGLFAHSAGVLFPPRHGLKAARFREARNPALELCF